MVTVSGYQPGSRAGLGDTGDTLGPCWPSLSASVFPEAVACHLKEVTHRNRCRNMLKYVQIMGHSPNKMNDIISIYKLHTALATKMKPDKVKVLIAKRNIIVLGMTFF